MGNENKRLDAERSSKNAASARKALPIEFDTLATPYLSSLLTIVYTLVTAQELLTRPVNWLVQQIRKAIAEQGTRAQIEAYFALQRQIPRRVMRSLERPACN